MKECKGKVEGKRMKNKKVKREKTNMWDTLLG